jgi:hypothetical protein
MDFAADMDKNLAPFGKGVRYRNADPVEAAGNFIRLFVKLPAGVEPGHYQFQGADVLGGMDVRRNTPAVILHPDNVVPLQNYQNIGTEALHGLVNGVIDNFKNQMMQAVNAGRPDIHTGTFANSLKPF